MVFFGPVFVSLPASSHFLFVLIYNCEFPSELFLMAWRLEVWLVRQARTGKQHCRTEHFCLLRTGNRKGKMLPKW